MTPDAVDEMPDEVVIDEKCSKPQVTCYISLISDTTHQVDMMI